MEDSRQNGLVLSADLGGTKICAAVVDCQGKVLSRVLRMTEAHRGPGRVIERLISTMSDSLQESGVNPDAVNAIGIGSPGPLDPRSGTIYSPPNLPGWDDICLAQLLRERLRLPCFVDNDVNVATLAEHRFGAAQGTLCAVGMFVGTGIGGGLIVDGRLQQGFNGTAGELGHMIVAANRARCNCGSNGCLEALASRTALVKRIKRLASKGTAGPGVLAALEETPDLPSTVIRDLYLAGEEPVVRVVDEAAIYIGMAIGGLINLLGPQVVVMGGGVIEAMWGLLEERVTRYAFSSSMDQANRNVRIVRAQLGDDAGIVGASIMARERLCSSTAETTTLIR